MNNPNHLPRVTYSNINEDFSGVHDELDRVLATAPAALFDRDHANVVAGAADEEGTHFAAQSPIDRGLCLGRFVAASPAAVGRAVAAAQGARRGWAGTPWPERVAVLRSAAEIIETRKYALAIACLVEVGKSRMEALGEVEEAIDLIRYYCDEMERNSGFDRPMERAFAAEATRCVLRPHGVFAVIAPFNFPVALSVAMITGALVTGNTAVFKPSPMAGLTGALLAGILHEAGVPRAVLNLICGGADVGRALIDDPRLAGAVFTGSHAVGMEIFRKFAARPYARPVIVEMGGKNPAYVTASADLDKAAAGVARSAFGLQGQKCSACSKVYVDERVYDGFLERLVDRGRSLKAGDPRDRDVFLGPLIDGAALERYRRCADAIRQEGALALGGEPLSGGVFDNGCYVPATVAVDLPDGHRLHRDELFLPLVTVRRFADLAQALADGNGVDYGLTAGIYTDDPAELEIFLETAEAGVLYANRASGATTGAWPAIQTFCGWKGSGVTGKGGLGPYYLPQFMREQSHTIMGDG